LAGFIRGNAALILLSIIILQCPEVTSATEVTFPLRQWLRNPKTEEHDFLYGYQTGLTRVSPPYLFSRIATAPHVIKAGIMPMAGFEIVISPKHIVIEIFNQA